MCGIIGSWVTNPDQPPVDIENFKKARDTMLSRGPDAEGIWMTDNNKLVVGHRRLSIIDLSIAAHQPFKSPCNNYCLVFNGEIYNYQELKERLKKKGYTFQTSSDTEVLLNICIEYGTSACSHLRGMFAFAFWDDRSKTLMLGRDHFGIKPLYFSKSTDKFVFASQVSALKALDTSLTNEPSEAGHVGFFLWGHVPEPFTLYKKIECVMPGEVVVVTATGSLRREVYFDINQQFTRQNTISVSGVNPFESLKDSVTHHLIADVPIGVFLSSGIDSTLIASVAASGNRQIRTLTLGFPEYKNTERDETVIAKKNAQLLKTVHSELWINNSNFFEEIELFFNSMDQPTIDGANTYFICKEAKAAGLKVVLSGLGGDEMFRGYSSFKDVPRLYNMASKFGKLSKPLGYLIRAGSWPILKKSVHYKYAGMLEMGNTIPSAYFLRRGLFMPWELQSIFEQEFITSGLQNLDRKINGRLDISHVKDPVQQVQIMELSNYLVNRLLRDSDWASMAHSIELRVPFIDIDVFTTMVRSAISGNVFTKNTLLNKLPEEISDNIKGRPKTGFNIPVQQWIIKQTNSKRVTLKRWAAHVYMKKASDNECVDYSKLKKIQ